MIIRRYKGFLTRAASTRSRRHQAVAALTCCCAATLTALVLAAVYFVQQLSSAIEPSQHGAARAAGAAAAAATKEAEQPHEWTASAMYRHTDDKCACFNYSVRVVPNLWRSSRSYSVYAEYESAAPLSASSASAFARRRLLYEIGAEQMESSSLSLICDRFHAVRRGPRQRVVSYSLYGGRQHERKYYDGIRAVAEQTRRHLVDWTVRIYYARAAISAAEVCALECELENVDFCVVDKDDGLANEAQRPPPLAKATEPERQHAAMDASSWWRQKFRGGVGDSGDNKNDSERFKVGGRRRSMPLAAYFGMYWRWLPAADSFVDYFMSRDLDAWITQRELEAVRVWLDSSTLFHIMRDHPFHFFPMLGGLWSLANVRDRSVGVSLIARLADYEASRAYNNRLYLEDQYFLVNYVWPSARLNATIHDSFYCAELDGVPFPSRRVSLDCFVSCTHCCDSTDGQHNAITKRQHRLHNASIWRACPEQCRQQPEWTYC